VEWFNQVDATYKSDVRELNEANMARIDRRFAAQDARIEQLFAAQDTRIDRRFAELEVKWEARFAALEIRIAHAQREQMRFLYLAFAAQMAVLMGIMLR
jgi:hypothetical protein